MNIKSEFGRFLQTRRGQLQPADVGLPMYDQRRRVPGLRRDELAELAGVSESYYTRLEQGRSSNASPEVLDALACTLRLDETERRHLHDLAGTARQSRKVRPRRLAPEQLNAATRQLLDVLGGVPAVVLNRNSDVLAWNPTGHTLFAGHLDPRSPDQPGRRPNTARMVFLDARVRDLYDDWPKKARDVVGKLRFAVGQYPDDPALVELIDELVTRSTEFTALWSEHRVRDWDIATHRMHHPLVGPVDVIQQAMPLPKSRGQRIVIVTTEPDSPSRAALTLLAQLSTSSVEHQESIQKPAYPGSSNAWITSRT
ncbi:helix-turn-helix transcriptional regulator [Amycolatopsis sp. lyj-23]|uniref:helix-turn-helix transcriptional regulator n=1 Tax=Amycolatopsis sp. lyj-23 TaxID=2789283 RepID=UPI00397B2325